MINSWFVPKTFSLVFDTLNALQACKVQSNIWSKIGRLKRSSMPKLTGGGTTFGAGASQGALTCIAGRLLCDTYLASRDLLKEVSDK